MLDLKAPLKILIDPVYTAKRISRCSSFWDLCKLVSAFCSYYPETIVYCIVPEEGQSFDVDYPKLYPEFPVMDQWHYIPCFQGRDRYQTVWFPSLQNRNIVSQAYGSYGDWDILVTNKNNGCYYFHNSTYYTHFLPYRFLYDTFPFFPFKKTFATSVDSYPGQIYSRESLNSYLAFNDIVINAKFEKDGIMAMAKRNLSCSSYKKLDENLHVCHNNPPFDTSYVLSQQAVDDFLTGETTNILFAQKITESQRNFSSIFKALQYLYSKLSIEQKITLGICTQSADGLPLYAQRDAKFLEFVSLPRLDFWEKLKKTHIQISFSVEEDMPKGILEGVLLGVIPVVSRYPWSIDFFGSDYPFFADDSSQAYAVIKTICRNRGKYFEMFRQWLDCWFIPKIMSRGIAVSLFIGKVENYIERLLAKAKTYKNDLANTLQSFVKSGCSVDMLALPKIKDMFTSIYDVRKLDIPNVAFHRQPLRWPASFILKQLHGWQPTDKPWELIRP